MVSKGRVILMLFLGGAVAVGVTLAYAATKMPEKDIVIESKAVFEKLTKSPVTFSHAKHKELKCTQCHHEYKDGKNVWQEGQEVKKCGECHKKEKQDKMPGLKDAMHKECIDCHKKVKAEKKKTGPTACAKCHPKKEGEKDEDEKK